MQAQMPFSIEDIKEVETIFVYFEINIYFFINEKYEMLEKCLHS